MTKREAINLLSRVQLPFLERIADTWTPDPLDVDVTITLGHLMLMLEVEIAMSWPRMPS